MKETFIILVRHGATEWNRISRYQGQLDAPLSREGLEQSRALAGALAALPLKAVYTSPLSRARICAEMVAAQHGLAVIPLPGLIEICHGEWEGKLLSEVEVRYADLIKQWRTYPYAVRMPAGESLAEVEERSWAALEFMAGAHPGEISLAVTHDTPIRTILRRILNLDQTVFWQIKLDNTGINVFGCRQGYWRVIAVNDTCHLGGWLKAGEQLAL
ncbi:histidine phosphatase family protein [Desulfofundulus thermosubterraneus]|uniref:Probable phosphoglycerate mutase n=1 Tax=Desulfofundulus thermosubterraneus DSM 16057 TaxID=1121432 RepID=A0A1M6LFJ9_9FIRM|nr:histidine phosphatase family protein [Desulfofundulus thermosubterraneus]SHJ69979.1 probable phosphoglycerate mutase [Desulfofundulus thermosubterraneus DSM 16057]